MSILNKSDKSSIGSAASDQLIKLFCEKSKIQNCSISNGVFNIYGDDEWSHMYLATDDLGLIAGEDSNASKLLGIKEIRIYKHVNITIKDNIDFNKNIVIRSQFNIHMLNSHKTNVLSVCNLNVDCDKFLLGSRFHIKDSTINASGIYGAYDKNALVNCKINLKK